MGFRCQNFSLFLVVELSKTNENSSGCQKKYPSHGEGRSAANLYVAEVTGKPLPEEEGGGDDDSEENSEEDDDDKGDAIGEINMAPN